MRREGLKYFGRRIRRGAGARPSPITIACLCWGCATLLLISACGDRAVPQDPSVGADSAEVGESQNNLDESAANCGTSPETILTGEGIGDLVIGRSVDEIADSCRVLQDTTAIRAEGHPQRVLSVNLGRDTVEAEIVDGKVWRITIRDAAFVTVDSLGVGTPMERILEFDGVQPLVGEGSLFVRIPAHCGLSFRLSEPASSLPPGEPDLASLRQLPEDTRVDEILVVGCQTG